MCSVQSFENTLAKFITLAFDVEPEMTHDEVHNILAQICKKTLGSLLNEAGKRIAFPQDFESRLKPLLAERNWLAHRIWADINGEVDPKALIRRIIKVGNEARELTIPIWHPTACMSGAYEFLRRDPEAASRIKSILG